MKRLPIIVCGAIVISLGLGIVEWSSRAIIAAREAELASYDHRDGMKEAELDLGRGTVKWKVHGRVGEYEIRSAILRERLGVHLDWFADCLTTEGVHKYAESYNATIRKHLVARYGAAAVYSVLGDPPQSQPD